MRSCGFTTTCGRHALLKGPDVDAAEWAAQQFALAEIAGQWGAYSYADTIAVCGDRLVAYRARISLGHAAHLDFILIAQLDNSIEKVEFVSLYDHEDLGAALAELDRSHGELTDC